MYKPTKQECLEEVIDHLRGLADGSIKPNDSALGLCYDLMSGDIGHYKLKLRNFYLHKWKFYSGCMDYCINHPTNISPGPGYLMSIDKWTGEYGERRKDLCRFIADELEDMAFDLIGKPARHL